MALERELSTYAEKLAELLSNEGKYAVIHGDEVQGIYDAYADAIRAGYEKNGLEPFLVKQISSVENIHFITRDLSAPPCHT